MLSARPVGMGLSDGGSPVTLLKRNGAPSARHCFFSRCNMVSKLMRVMMAVAIAGTFSLGLGCEKEEPAPVTPPPTDTVPTDGSTPPPVETATP